MHVYACLCQFKAIKEKLSFVPDTSFPLRFCTFFPPSSVFSLRSLQFLRVSWNPGNAASSQCWCALVQDPLVWGHASALRKAGAWRDHSTLIACQNTHRSEKRRLGKEEKGTKSCSKRAKKATLIQLIPTLIRLKSLNTNLKLWLKSHYIKIPKSNA